jgi:EsV-1-7 cysteine-rich motif
MVRVHAGEYRSRQAGAPKEEARKKQCVNPDCTVQASYGFAYDKKLIRCVKHIEEGMIKCTPSYVRSPLVTNEPRSDGQIPK